jgi:hypothetical protein
MCIEFLVLTVNISEVHHLHADQFQPTVATDASLRERRASEFVTMALVARQSSFTLH